MSMYIILFIAYTFVFNTKIIISNMYLLNAIKSTSNEWSYLSLEKNHRWKKLLSPLYKHRIWSSQSLSTSTKLVTD